MKKSEGDQPVQMGPDDDDGANSDDDRIHEESSIHHLRHRFATAEIVAVV
jgi:hypothetical protein